MNPILKFITVLFPLIMVVFAIPVHETIPSEVVQVTIAEPEIEEIDPLRLLNPILIPVCGCESVGSPTARPVQFNADGSVLRGRINPLDWGMCQINSYYWGDEAERLGLDIMTEEGNVLMANHILETQGIGAWIWSNDCHHALD